MHSHSGHRKLSRHPAMMEFYTENKGYTHYTHITANTVCINQRRRNDEMIRLESNTNLKFPTYPKHKVCHFYFITAKTVVAVLLAGKSSYDVIDDDWGVWNIPYSFKDVYRVFQLPQHTCLSIQH